MSRIEKTVFISYRRTDVYTALAVYENLKNQGYDVFFDYRSISSGDFEQIITGNIKARAHFLLILTPTALDRLNEPGDWLRREIEIAIDEKRNIIPLFFKGFRFGVQSVSDMLTGKLKTLSRYNGLNMHEDYFDEAMHRLRTEYLNRPLDTVLHPVSTEVQKVVIAEQVAADRALEQIEDVQELVKQGVEKPAQIDKTSKPVSRQTAPGKESKSTSTSAVPWRKVAGGVGGIALLGFVLWGGSRLIGNPTASPPEATQSQTVQPAVTGGSPAAITDTDSPTQTSIAPTPAPGVGSTLVSDKDGMILLYVPAGEFPMGSDSGVPNEAPIHTVYLDAFWIDQTEVTNEMYSLCAEIGICPKPTNTSSFTHTSYYGNSEHDHYPVIYVDWSMARTYCEWAGRRLPTEAEWEKAARGTDQRIYPWGNSIDQTYANYNSSVGDTTKVGNYEKGKSFYGALDMAGNVWEWVNDWYSETYYSSFDPGSAAPNPLGPDLGEERVLRGGSWGNPNNSVRSANRTQSEPDHKDGYAGFRCAMGVTP